MVIFVVASDKTAEAPWFCYIWDEWRNNPEFDKMIERVMLPKGNPDKLYVYTITEEDGIATISKGWCIVNRIGYLFSKVDVEIPECGIRYW